MSTCLNGGRGSCQGGNSNCLLEQQFLALGWVSHWSQSNSSSDDFTDSNGVNNCKWRNLFPLYIYIYILEQCAGERANIGLVGHNISPLSPATELPDVSPHLL